VSRSAAVAKERREPLAKSPPAQDALALLARLLRYGEISYHGGFINLAPGATLLQVYVSEKGRVNIRLRGRFHVYPTNRQVAAPYACLRDSRSRIYDYLEDSSTLAMHRLP
jgi:hypothetical protein